MPNGRVVVMGDMDPEFLRLPPEVIRLSMRTHQKYFSVRDPKTGGLAPKFITVANIEASDGGKTIAEGNAKVLSARLDDARFFWDNDKKTPLEDMAAKLGTIAFKEELGSIGDKVERVAALARELAPKVGADPDLAERAAKLCKADLVSEMVYEFPELQGVMGRYYALSQSVIPDERSDDPGSSGKPGQTTDKTPDSASGPSGVTPILAGLSKAEIEQVANAISDHYKPQGPSDAVPSDPVSIAVALADKLDTLVGFWAIDEKPTGSKDPFALRRAALGVVRIVLENGVRLNLSMFIDGGYQQLTLSYRITGLIEFEKAGGWRDAGLMHVDTMRDLKYRFATDKDGEEFNSLATPKGCRARPPRFLRGSFEAIFT